MRWSISIRADGDRPMERDEIVELADAVAEWEGIASGIGSMSYSAQLVIEAPTPDEAVDRAIEVFTDAARIAGLPPWPVAWAESVSEEAELEELQ
ncbi:MAG: hypothetical protein R3258_09285 [Acidimicrobiia bacterium]|nr:hypothetical protein [Acidimicrobiia bacterium]